MCKSYNQDRVEAVKTPPARTCEYPEKFSAKAVIPGDAWRELTDEEMGKLVYSWGARKNASK